MPEKFSPRAVGQEKTSCQSEANRASRNQTDLKESNKYNMKSHKCRVPPATHDQDITYDLPKKRHLALTQRRTISAQHKRVSQNEKPGARKEQACRGRQGRFSTTGKRVSRSLPQHPQKRNTQASIQAWMEFARLDSAKSLVEACEVIHLCQNANGIDNVRLCYNLRTPILMAHYAARAILAGIKLGAILETRSRSGAMERGMVTQIMAWHRAKYPKYRCIKEVLTELVAEWKQVHP